MTRAGGWYARAMKLGAPVIAVIASLAACVPAREEHPHAQPAAHWDYTGRAGPATWGALSPAYRRCTAGRSQSPIDLDPEHADHARLPALDVHYGKTTVLELDNGHTIEDDVPPGLYVELGGERYELRQFHFHHPSEHTIHGEHFPLEVHFVHRGPRGRLLVLGVLIAEGAAQPALGLLFHHIPHDHETVRLAIDPAQLLPADRRYLIYAGSLTTPPCTEGVTWIVLATPIAASADQLARFHAVFPNNSRPLMPRNARPVRAGP